MRKQKGGSVLGKLKSFGSVVNNFLKRSKVLSSGARNLGHSNLSAFLETQGYGKRRKQKGGSVLGRLRSFIPRVNELVKRSKVLSTGARNLGYNNVASFLETQGYGKRLRQKGRQRGAGFWSDFVSGFKKGFSAPLKVASALGVPGASQVSGLAGLVGLGRRRQGGMMLTNYPYRGKILVDNLGSGKRIKSSRPKKIVVKRIKLVRVKRNAIKTSRPKILMHGGGINSLSPVNMYEIRPNNKF